MIGGSLLNEGVRLFLNMAENSLGDYEQLFNREQPKSMRWEGRRRQLEVRGLPHFLVLVSRSAGSADLTKLVREQSERNRSVSLKNPLEWTAGRKSYDTACGNTPCR